MNSYNDHIPDHIPILTEVISLGPDAEPIVMSNVQEEPNQQQATQPQTDQSTPSSNLEHSLAQLEKTLHESVLRQLLARVDFVLEHRIKDGLAEALQTATDELTQKIRLGLTTSLDEVIHRAISQEISKIDSLKSK